MATSPSHKFGQIIGDVLEAAIQPLLEDFAHQHKLYLDKKGFRPAREGLKVSWKDLYGNSHDLDYVIERNGTDDKFGAPVAFIETAWRRYTKHSRNKAQEIQSAILPLVATHRYTAPFIGVVLAGVFTQGALDQLHSQGFAILYFPLETVVDAFQTVGIDATFYETTPDAVLKRKVRAWEKLPKKKKLLPAQKLVQINSDGVKRFLDSLDRHVKRMIRSVRILPLQGVPIEAGTVEEAIKILEGFSTGPAVCPIIKYEVQIGYNNGDKILAEFTDKEGAIKFLRDYLPPVIVPG